MSVNYYVVGVNHDAKLVLIFDIGSSIEVDLIEEFVSRLEETLENVDEDLEKFAEIVDKRVVDLTVEDVTVILSIVRSMVQVKYENDITTYGDLVKTLKVWGLVKALKVPGVNVSLYSEYSGEFIDLVKEYEEHGYKIVWW